MSLAYLPDPLSPSDGTAAEAADGTAAETVDGTAAEAEDQSSASATGKAAEVLHNLWSSKSLNSELLQASSQPGKPTATVNGQIYSIFKSLVHQHCT